MISSMNDLFKEMGDVPATSGSNVPLIFRTCVRISAYLCRLYLHVSACKLIMCLFTFQEKVAEVKAAVEAEIKEVVAAAEIKAAVEAEMVEKVMAMVMLQVQPPRRILVQLSVRISSKVLS